MQPGDLIYSRHWVREWPQWRPSVTGPYRLLSNFHDRSIAGATALTILDDPWLDRWYGVNAVLRHPKLTPIPFGLRVRPPRALTPLPARDLLCYANFSRYTAERRHLWTWAEGHPFVTPRVWEKHGQATYWRDLSHAQFVLCPAGFGLDTWRIWEALALGAVPICRHSPLDHVLVGLPVVLVDAWEDITEARLHDTATIMAEERTAGRFALQRLRREYWEQLIHPGSEHWGD